MRQLRTLLVAWCTAAVVSAAFAQDHGWHALEVPGGRATLRALGVDDSRERAVVMIELVRRLHFATRPPLELEAALRKMPAPGRDAITVPMPMARASWEKLLDRSTPGPGLFQAILNDPAARLLFHGLAGLDGPTRRWFEGEPDLLRAIYRNPDAVKVFALFGPAVRVSGGRIVVPGGDLGDARWSGVLGTPSSEPRRFVSRLFLDRGGRAAGLYFLIASVEAPRQQFLLDGSRGGDRFGRLVVAFASCYPRESNDYPFVLRSPDPALLLLNAALTGASQLKGPRSRAFWDGVFAADDLVPARLPAGSDEIDALWLVERLCSAPTRDRGSIFMTLLAGQRLFAASGEPEAADAILALRVRRLFPAVFLALERAGIRDAATIAALGRYAQTLDRLNDPTDTPIVLRQFQGALSVLLGAARAGTVDETEIRRLLLTLAEVRVIDGRYDGRLAAWIDRELLPAFGSKAAVSAEAVVARAIGGPAPARPTRVQWEGHDYVIDYQASTRDRVLAVRERQGGATLDRALQSVRAATSPAASRSADALLAQVLASWAYAPHVGSRDSGALVGGDASTRHDLGLRDVNRTRFEQRWALALAPGDRGVIAGSYLGLEAALANWSLRRMSADVIPPEPTLGDNDRMSLLAGVSLSDPRQLTDADMHRIAAAIDAGSRVIEEAAGDGPRLDDVAARAAISPWRRAVLPWMLVEEPDRVREQFPLSARASLGGVAASRVPAWGTSGIPFGCLCVASPPSGIPELVVGRPVDGIVSAHSVDLMFRVAQILTELKMPAPLAPAVLAYAMRDYIDRVRPAYPGDTEAFARQATALTQTLVEDYLGAIAAVGPLRPVQ
jgi:hypothetical protein